MFDTYAPVVAWPTVCLFLILALTLQWCTCLIDYSSAFVQDYLKHPVFDSPTPRLRNQLSRQDVSPSQEEPLRTVSRRLTLVSVPGGYAPEGRIQA